MSAAAIMARQNRWIRRFLKAKATDEKHARKLTDVGCKNSPMFRRMVDQGVFIACANERYYLDEAGCEAFRARRLRRVVVAILAVIAIVVIASLLK